MSSRSSWRALHNSSYNSWHMLANSGKNLPNACSFFSHMTVLLKMDSYLPYWLVTINSLKRKKPKDSRTGTRLHIHLNIFQQECTCEWLTVEWINRSAVEQLFQNHQKGGNWSKIASLCKEGELTTLQLTHIKPQTAVSNEQLLDPTSSFTI